MNKFFNICGVILCAFSHMVEGLRFDLTPPIPLAEPEGSCRPDERKAVTEGIEICRSSAMLS